MKAMPLMMVVLDAMALLGTGTLLASPFSPQQGTVAPVERPFRDEVCLNGRWRFQPVPLPSGYKFEKGIVPDLPLPSPDKWETVPLKVPSPWNANSWGCGTDVGAGTKRPYDPDSLYYPSYPESWRHVRMGWLARTFTLKEAPRADQRLILHFESVAGDCRVRVNGRDAGTHFDKYLPFDLDVTDLVKQGANEIEVGIRDHKLFNRRERDYTKMVQPYPAGSNTDGLVGLWQDVSLVTVPAVRVADVFVKSEVSSDRLTLDLTLHNDSANARKVRPYAQVYEWVNCASGDPMQAEDPKWRLGERALRFGGDEVTVPAQGEASVSISARVGNRLKPWTPDAPNLSAAVVTLGTDEGPVDRKYVRFGWREFTIRGRDLLLNGERIELKADILHPFGAYSFSSRFVRAWYTMIKDMHGNAVRPHAQIYPRCYLDLADEMGLCVLDETAVFGSSINSNFKMEEFWTRWVDHYRGLVMRDRNHPSVFGWSVGNEMFAIALLNKIPEGPEKTAWYDRIADIGLMARTWDPTRAFITCDGDEDLGGKLPTWSKHFGHHPRDVEKECKGVQKPLVVGENGGTYYARPADLYRLGAEAAYRDYAGRNEALAADVYSNYVCMARGRLAYWSASETAWFGLEPLPLGYTDHTRLPDRSDGIRFADVPDGTWGPQVERMPPYVTTFNPGFDPALPLYRPLAMFLAHKAAMDPRGPQPCAWDRYPAKPVRPAPPKDVKPGVNRLVFVSNADELAEANRLTGGKLSLTDRTATQLVRASETDPAVASFTVDELYFAEAGETDELRRISRHGFDGTTGGEVLLTASNTDWSLFNRRAENAKVAAITCYEQLRKPAGAVLVAYPAGEGRIFVTTVERNPQTVRGRHFLRRLCANIGVPAPFDETGVLGAGEHEHDLLLDGPKD